VTVPVLSVARSTAKAAPLSPEEATQRDQIRRLLNVLTVVAVAAGTLVAATATATGSPTDGAIAIMTFGFATLLVAGARPLLADGRVESAVMVMALAAIAIILFSAIVRPSSAITVAALLIPITAAVPYLEAKSLRRLMILTWLGSTGAAAANLFRDGLGLGQIWGSMLVYGLLLFLLYQASEKLKASSREFRRLFSLSSDLAETAEAGVLGDLVARHLAEATGFDDCVLYALGTEGSHLTPFGSHPAERSLQTDAQSTTDRPVLGRVIHDRVRVAVNAADENVEVSERDRLRALGRTSMLLLPLVAHSEPVGVAELTSVQRRSIDERRLALARTLAFEAATAIANGRLYQELHERSLHDALTGLANRALFMDRVGHAVAKLGRRPGGFLAVLFVDLDNFKAVNDSLGHARGDRLLALVAERLLLAVRGVDTVARLGGDEFAVLLEDLTTEAAALVVAERAVTLLAAPFDLAGKSASVSASIGVAVRSDDSTGTDTLIAEADAAMYEAKRAGKGRVVSSRR
jgi:diguanylate cyclase (GGDEF)-like protein